jgi:hypothetical protein
VFLRKLARRWSKLLSPIGLKRISDLDTNIWKFRYTTLATGLGAVRTGLLLVDLKGESSLVSAAANMVIFKRLQVGIELPETFPRDQSPAFLRLFAARLKSCPVTKP